MLVFTAPGGSSAAFIFVPTSFKITLIPMSRSIRFGLYGCNMYRTRDLVAGAEAAAPGVVKITACYDIDQAKARFAAEKYHGRAFDSLDAFLACEEVDVVLISLPAHLHAEAYARTAKSGKTIYLEKPICVDAKGRRTVTDAFTAYPAKCYVGMSYRYINPFLKVAEILRRPGAGRVIGAHHHWVSAWPLEPLKPEDMGWRHRLDQSGGQLNHHCCHALDWLQWIGGPFSKVSAVSYTPPNVREMPHEERELTAAFTYRDGGMAVFNLHQDSHQYVQYGTIHAEGLGISYQWGEETFVKVYTTKPRQPDEVWTPGANDPSRDQLQMTDFINAWFAGAAMPISIPDGLRVYDYATAIRKSYQNGHSVDVARAGQTDYAP